MKPGQKIWMKWIKLAILLYCIPGIILFCLQDKFLLHPAPLDKSHVFTFHQPYKENWISMNGNSQINVIRFLPVDTANVKGAIIYFHGNRENVERYASLIKIFTNRNYEVWMPDYPGFGKSTGVQSEQAFYEVATQVYKLVNSHFKADHITVYGKSLGTGFAAYIAATEPVKQLILETPYYSIPDVFNSFAPIYPTRWMSKFKVPTYKYLSETVEPICIFQGTDDGVIFYRRAKKLRAFLKPADTYYLIEGGKHNNLFEYPQYKQAIDSLLP
ncbi:MAG: alpha/beta fold hydrolase [Chitinophagaceae bacterium]|nr:alpha/beta fold hydrolase [Bacteroidota bacterium]MCC6258935.1 alpha/beta fold hydrolase [Chitinophagaceae bacterium]MCW5916464.1 alpha/beta fold hydrolase [Ferruginibacter sp.]